MIESGFVLFVNQICSFWIVKKVSQLFITALFFTFWKYLSLSLMSDIFLNCWRRANASYVVTGISQGSFLYFVKCNILVHFNAFILPGQSVSVQHNCFLSVLQCLTFLICSSSNGNYRNQLTTLVHLNSFTYKDLSHWMGWSPDLVVCVLSFHEISWQMIR